MPVGSGELGMVCGVALAATVGVGGPGEHRIRAPCQFS
jgi:hypothetical protein